MCDERSNVVEDELESELVDMSGISLDELGSLPRNALVTSLRRILTECERQPPAFSQYCSVI